MTVLVTGGAGFVGSNLALMWKRDHADRRVVALDNLRRRGSELALPRLRAGGVEFQHGDIRNPEDLAEVGAFDLLLECSAEPSVHAGYDGSPDYLIHTNLVGTKNCLEAARRHRADTVFLSTSRVYPIDPLRALELEVEGQRLVPKRGAKHPTGFSAAGISTDFPLGGHRSLYGATKLCSEHLIEVVNRCGVLTGPWQMDKVDQGFIVLWASRHLFGKSLAYMGFGGHGHQVRDLLHVADLYDLLRVQVRDVDSHKGRVYNVGGGLGCSVSLAELTAKSAARTDGVSPTIASDPKTRAADIPYYVTDNALVTAQTGWAPRRSVDDILDDVFRWLRDHRAALEPILA